MYKTPFANPVTYVYNASVAIQWLTTVTALMSACDLISNSTTDKWPLPAAKCNGVPLFYLQ